MFLKEIRTTSKIFFFSLIFFISSSDVFSQESTEILDLKAKLKQITSIIVEDEELLKNQQKEQSEIEKELQSIKKKLGQTSLEKENIESILETKRNYQKELQSDLSDIGQEFRQLKHELSQTLKNLYVLERKKVNLIEVLDSQKINESLKQIKLLQKLAIYQKAKFDRLAGLSSSINSGKIELSKVKEEKLKNFEKFESLAQSIRLEEQKQIDLLESSKRKNELILASISRLKEKENELQIALARVLERGSIDFDSSSFKGLESIKGSLPLPIQGEIVQRFGKKKHGKFSDTIFVKGLEFKAIPRSQVRSIASGKLIFSQILPAYGNIVIVDHGLRYYSLYGRLSKITKSVGDTVAIGDVIALCDESLSDDGGNFYFELRKAGKAIDPKDFFKDL